MRTSETLISVQSLYSTGRSFQMWESSGRAGGRVGVVGVQTEIKETAGQGHLSTCLPSAAIIHFHLSVSVGILLPQRY